MVAAVLARKARKAILAQMALMVVDTLVQAIVQ
jgi:hypothetical protein